MRLIDADALEREGWLLCRTFREDKNTMVYEVKKPSDFPTIEERKTGRWIRHPEKDNIYGGKCVECSECGERYLVQYIEDEKFCRHCGAKMEE